jgi:DNA polymerase-1
LKALSLLGVELSDLQDQTLLDHREDHELVHTLYLYRKKANTLSRYSKWIPDFFEDGRMYPQLKVAAAVTGRVLYSDPNAQGIDKKNTDEFRRCMRAGDGHAIVKGDFAQQELRIAAYYSKDKNMLETFANGEGIYLKTAAKLVGKPVDKDHPARQAAKRATLSFLYGLGTEKYRQNVYKDTGERLTQSQANKDREAFRAAFPEFYRWQQIYGAKHEWETRSTLGWRRVVAADKDNKPKYTERLNGPIQSTAGDILYLTLKKLAADRRPGTHFLLSVHDELLLVCPKEDAREVALWLGAKMCEAMEEILGAESLVDRSVLRSAMVRAGVSVWSWRSLDECPGAVPILVCHDEEVVECDAEHATDVETWLERAMVEGMDVVLNGTEEVDVPIEVEARIVKSWGEGS